MNQTPNWSFLLRMGVCGHSFPLRHHRNLSNYHILTAVGSFPSGIHFTRSRGAADLHQAVWRHHFCVCSKPDDSKTAVLQLVRVLIIVLSSPSPTGPRSWQDDSLTLGINLPLAKDLNVVPSALRWLSLAAKHCGLTADTSLPIPYSLLLTKQPAF